MLTKRQKEILDFINDFIKENDYAPSYEEIASHFKLKSVATIHEHIENLKREGYLIKQGKQSRALEIQTIKIPLLGTIAAGLPIEAIEDKEEIEVEKSMVSDPKDHYALKVKGDSMIDEGIFDRDTVIIRRQETVENGEKVVAIINGNEATLKKIYKEKNRIRLQPANPKIKPIFVKDIEIRGKVVNVVRSFVETIKKSKTPKEKKDNKFINLPTNNEPLILIGDVIKKLKEIPSESISCVVTSPPYWNLRDYEDPNQIGQEKTPEGYINKMTEVCNALRRVLKRDGSFFLNIGDTYFDRDLQLIPHRLALELQKNGWKLRNQIIWYKPNHMPSSIKNRFGNTWEPIFFFIRSDCKKKYYFDLDSIRIPHKSNGDVSKRNNLPKYISEKTYQRYYSHLTPKKRNDYNGKFNGQEKNLGASPGARQSVNDIFYSRQRKYEVDSFEICNYLKEWKKKSGLSTKYFDKYFGYKDTAGHWFRTDESGRSLPNPEEWLELKKILRFDNKYDKVMTATHYVLQTVDYHPKGKNPGDMWAMNTDKLKEAHFAIFPKELPERIIKACCPKDGIVLDPFAGSGTTGVIAKELNRKSIMIDINPDYKKIMEKRLKSVMSKLPL